MEIEVSVTLLLHKLRNLLALKGIVYSRSRVLATEAIKELDLMSKWIRDAKEGTISSRLVTSNRKVFLSMEDFIDEFIVKAELWRQNNFIKIVPPLIRLASLSDEIFLRNEMDRVIDHARSLNKCAPNEPTGASGSHSQLLQGPQLRNVDSKGLDDSNYIGFYDEEIKLVAQLFDEIRSKSETVRSIIAVTGKAGSGKTVLTKTVYNKKNVKRVFNHRAWVNVSENFEARDFLVDILTQLSWENLDENLSDDDLVLTLERLAKANCCLIVVDDVRTRNDLDKLSNVSRYIGGRSRLILTTRNEAIASDASPQREPVRVRPLTDDESWALFVKKAPMAEDRFTTSETLISFKKKILRKCVGSPQAILILGGLLSTTNPSEWSSVIDQLSTTDIGELSRLFEADRLPEEELKELFSVIDPAARKKILDLSYQDLPSRMKFCFLYLGLFPRAVYIPVRRLFHHWLAEGLVTPLPKEQMAEDPAEGLNTPLREPADPAEGLNTPLPEPEDLAEDYFNQLIRRNMIEVANVRLDGSPKTCRMPGSLWDVFHPKAVDLRLFHVHNNTAFPSAQTGSFEHRIQRLAEYAGIQSYPSSDSFIQYLRTYVSFNTRKRDLPTQEIGMFLTSVVTKRGFGLLIVLDLEKVYKPTLPDILGKLLHLKYLGLRWTFLDSLPMSVGNLPYLETLDVKHTIITTLPSSIWKAKNLRHLYLNEIYIDMSIKQPNSGSLTNIRTLWGLFIGRRSHVETCLDMLIGLRKLGLTCNSSLVGAIAGWISKLTDLRSLRLRSSDQFGRPSTLELREMQNHCKLSDLYLVGQLTRPINEYQFPLSLKIITLSVSQIEEDPMPILGQLSELNILRLLRHSYTGTTMTCRHNEFVKLRVLKLWMLENLKEWIVEEGAMPQLEELEIRSCDKLNQPKNLQLITNLKEVTLTNMPNEFVAKFKRVMATAIVRPLRRVFAPLLGENVPRQ